MKHKYIFGFLLCVLCLCFYLFHIIYAEAKEKAIAELNSRQMIHAKQAQGGIEVFFSDIVKFLTSLSASTHIVDLDDQGKNELDFALTIKPEAIKAITRVDANRKISYTTPLDITVIGRDISSQKHIQEIFKTQRPVVSDVFTAVQGYRAIALHVPVFKGNEFRGTLAVLIDFLSISKRFLQDIRVGETGYAWMTSREGIELYCPVPRHTGKSVFETTKNFPTIISMANEMVKGKKGVTTYKFDRIRNRKLEKLEKQAVYLPINIVDSFWTIVVASSEDEVLAGLVSFKNNLIMLIGLILVCSAIFSYYNTKAWGIVREAAERKKTEKALRESEERFRTLVEKSPLGISLIGKDGRYKYINHQFSIIFGYQIEDIPKGTAWFKKSFPDKDYRQKVMKTWVEDQKDIKVGQARPRVFTVTCRDGSQKEIYFRPVTMENYDQLVIYEDITDKARMEQQLQQAQKFEAIGTLAGGIAHDFNNLLMGIQGRTSLIETALGPSDPKREHTKAIEEYVRSASDLTKQLLGFARGGKYEVKPLDLDELMLATAAMFGRTRKEIQIHTKTQQESLVVEADKRQIEQVLLNLFVNAWQAMPDGGKLYLSTKLVSLDEAACEPHQVEPGRYNKISVTDTGIGMDEATRQRIFDPFFTTKEKGRGTGLGLASAYGIIKNHGGMITVYSELGHGTTFNIYLPASEKGVRQEVAPDRKTIQGSETILLVDDEDMIIDVGQAMLERLGYRVIVANGGEQAVETISEMGKIDLVILDLIMPVMDGSKVFDRIREIKPHMPVLLSSGYAINGQASEIMRRGCNGFIQKPFNISELSQKVRKVLSEAKGSSQQ